MSDCRCCPACGSADTHDLLTVPGVPVHIGALWPTAESARACPRGDLTLVHCRRCRLIYNRTFDARLTCYDGHYDNSLDSSPEFRRYARGLAERLVQTYELHGKTIIEIGCGQGEFISQLCELGGNRGFGYDTACDGSPSSRVQFVRAHYSERQTAVPADLICCRHVLEHIPEPLDFLRTLRRSLGDRRDTVIYFEVPNVAFIVEGFSIWDLIYEHCSYFGRNSLAHLFTRAGFEVLDLRTEYAGQFVSIEARPGLVPCPVRPASNGDHDDAVNAFASQFAARRQLWQLRLKQLAAAGKRVAIWGAGAKTVTFANLFGLDDQIAGIVDINRRKQGGYLAGTGQRIEAPDSLKALPPDVVIVMNAIYTPEIRRELARLGVACELLEAGE
jgi:SAM-dependent methyltransferase